MKEEFEPLITYYPARLYEGKEWYVGFYVIYLVFHTLIRPIEITRLRVRGVNLKNQVIVIPGAAAKSGKMRISTIPNVPQESLQEYIGTADPKSFLVSESMCPGKKPISERRLRYKWTNLREALDLPMEYKMYSLRDSGIVQKLQDGISPEEVMKQAGHHSIEITTIYVNHVNP